MENAYRLLEDLKASNLFDDCVIDSLGYGSALDKEKKRETKNKTKAVSWFNEARELKKKGDLLFRSTESRTEGVEAWLQALYLYVRSFLDSERFKPIESSSVDWKTATNYCENIISILGDDHESYRSVFKYCLSVILTHKVRMSIHSSVAKGEAAKTLIEENDYLPIVSYLNESLGVLKDLKRSYELAESLGVKTVSVADEEIKKLQFHVELFMKKQNTNDANSG